MTRALVTGGTGFVGSNIALYLLERHWDVRILERSGASREVLEGGQFEFVSGDVLEPETLLPAMRGIDVIFHAAGVVDYWKQGVERMYQVNVNGTRNVMEAALKSGIERIAHISSAAALGIHPNEIVDESYTFNVKPGQFVYGHSKYLAEGIAFEYVEKGLPVVIVNPTTAIGPRDARKVSSGMVIEVVKHRVPPLVPPGGINVIPVCDAAQGTIEAAVKGRLGERYILGGDNITHLELYRTIANVVGCGMKLKAMPRWQVSFIAGLTDMLQPQTNGPVPLTGDRLRLESKLFYYNTTKARSIFDIPRTPLHIAIGRTYEWFEMMGEFEGVFEGLDNRYCEWPPPISQRTQEGM
jgi:dihydroflavonol-4-reductase